MPSPKRRTFLQRIDAGQEKLAYHAEEEFLGVTIDMSTLTVENYMGDLFPITLDKDTNMLTVQIMVTENEFVKLVFAPINK